MEQNLKAGQHKVLEHLKRRRAVFGLMPTGYGKSRCFQVPAFCWGWRVIVISPLISLMEDQALALKDRAGAYLIHANLPRSETRGFEAAVAAGDWNIIYISPERLVAWQERGLLQKLSVDLLAVDEAHCIESWSDFRPAYLKMSSVIRELSKRGTTILALTATLPAIKGRALVRSWCGGARVVAMPLGRENLSTYLIPCERYGEKHLVLTSILSRIGCEDAAIIYCASRARTEELADILSAMGFPAVAYHAGLPADGRARCVEGFRAGRIRFICATAAFGMGIDYGKVRAVVHFDFPDSVESYWQEAGRAGRDQRPAVSAVLWTRSDLLRFRAMSAERKKKAWQAIELFLGGQCRKRLLEAHFGMRYRSGCGGCNFCRAEKREKLPDILAGVEGFVDRCVWWLAPEAEPRTWMARFLEPAGRKATT